MKKYAAYKPSGDEWLGDVPTHWEIKRADFVTESTKTPVSEAEMEGREIVHYSIPAIQEFGGPITEPGDDVSSGKLLINRRQLLISKLNPRKATLCIAEPTKGTLTVASTEFVSIVPLEGIDLQYTFYVWGCSKVTHFLSGIVRSVTRSHQRAEPHEIRKILWAWPSHDEQRAIAAFLDERTAHLDGLIRRKEDLLKLLAEQRAALITRAVTRGLDAAAPLRDSGVPWLGQVPAHWQVKRLKFLVASIRGGGTPATGNPDFWNGPIPWVSPKDMKVDRISSTEDYVTELALENSSTELVAVNSILLVVRSGILKHTLPVAINTVPVALNQDMKAVIPTKEVTPEYLALLLKGLQSEILAFCTKISATVDSIEMDDLANFDLPIPPVDEQIKICSFITAESAKILPTITSVEKTVEKLREYRAALITAAVTGRIDVRPAVVPTPKPALADAL